MLLTAGARLGPYEIVTPLGAGAMGEVYRGRDTRLDRVVAIKILPAAVAEEPQRRERFRREARAISSLTHPHICTLHDIGTHDGVDYLVMEYLPGETLAHRLLRGPLPLEDVLRIAVQLADALDAAHRHGLTHRDLKPANVMLTAAGAKVLDFGLAKWHGGESGEAPSLSLAAADPTLTQVGGVVGTIQYMAPEQLQGQPADTRSDLFALGALIYEMTTGRKAFEGTSATSVAAAILSVVPSPMATVQPLTPPSLDRLVRKCLAKDPAKRWQTAADLRDELLWIEEGTAAAMPEPSTKSTPRPIRPFWVGAATTLAVLLAALAVFTIALVNRIRSDVPAPATSFVVLPPDNASGAEQPAISPDGRRLAFIARASDGKSALWVRPLESLESHPIADADDRAFPFWSPDSQSLAFFSHGQLKRVDAAGGLIQVICEAPAGRGGAWSRDGVIIFAPSSETWLSRVAAGGGTPARLTSLDAPDAERSHRFPQFLADSRRFIYTVYFNNAERKPVVKVASLDSPTATTRLTETSFVRSWAPPGYLLFQREFRGPYLAQRFDLAALRLTGEAMPVVDRVAGGPVGGAAALSVSSNGVLAYEKVTADPMTQLTWFARTGQRLGIVGPPASIGQNFEDFSLSSDGLRVASVRTDPQTRLNDMWVIDIARGAASRVTVDGTVADPTWSPTGERVAFSSNRRGTGNSDLYATRWNGNRSEEPLLISVANKFLWDWSRDGSLLLFGAQEGSKAVSNLWVLPLGGGGVPRAYLRTEFNKAEARFSPDAQSVAYQSDESGRMEVYVASFPEPTTHYQVSAGGGTHPRWRRDGKELFYLGQEGKVMGAAVQTAPAFEVGRATALFSIPSAAAGADLNFDVAPDGQRFLVADLVRGAVRSPITIVLNWTAGLKKQSEPF